MSRRGGSGVDIHVSPTALRAFCGDLEVKVRPLLDAASKVAWLPISAGRPFGAGYPSEDVAQFAMHHAACARALTDFLDGVAATLDALHEVASMAADAYEHVDTRASVTADWVDITLTDRESQMPAVNLGNSGVALPEVG
jgi:hypothetical protein